MKILRYDMKALVKYSALMTIFSQGTVFTMDKTALWNVALMAVIGICSCGLTSLLSIHNWSELANLDVEPLENLASQINAFVPFCLALYVSLTLSRWWALRIQALGKVFDSFANTVMIISCELHDKKWMTLRNQVAKYGFASVELLVQAARDESSFDRLIEYDFLTDPECQALEKVDQLWQRPMVVWAWIMRICISAMDHQKVPPPRVNTLMAQCVNAREGMATINTYLDTQLPFAYVHLITLLVNVQNLVVSVKSGIIFATALPELNFFLMIQQTLTLLIVCFIYQALLQISYMIMDPFGDDVLDFPIKAYTSYLAASIDAMMEAQPECPVVAEDGSLHRPKPKKVHPQSTPSSPKTDGKLSATPQATSASAPLSPTTAQHAGEVKFDPALARRVRAHAIARDFAFGARIPRTVGTASGLGSPTLGDWS
eukprot:CAMPEP_0171206328 /NCGR_PEP_ID=MMETSP0790-20130122/27006_1 /TAXON_ID=2925 /ORGANISM="Alexandrium catenella, Strain OF101" /LENGTH=429 /DNA_ID=CAMNT_0011671869 /DNA_START=144 /DNA_END=1431 /DNA_ORIENTATION=+